MPLGRIISRSTDAIDSLRFVATSKGTTGVPPELNKVRKINVKTRSKRHQRHVFDRLEN